MPERLRFSSLQVHPGACVLHRKDPHQSILQEARSAFPYIFVVNGMIIGKGLPAQVESRLSFPKVQKQQTGILTSKYRTDLIK